MNTFTFLTIEYSQLSAEVLCRLLPVTNDVQEDAEDIVPPKLYHSKAIQCPPNLDISGFIGTIMLPLADPETGEQYLMLDDDGRDCSWLIADAFYENDYAPPLFCCDLPRMSGEQTRHDDKIVGACQDSIQERLDQLTRLKQPDITGV